GDARAYRVLGDMYISGGSPVEGGLPKDDGKAAKYYQKAGEMGESSAYAMLGDMYQDGQGVPKDLGKAKEYYKKACDMGYKDTCFSSSKL
ncbi:tetratricopeptide repeat protein, partial [Helicobacter felis]